MLSPDSTSRLNGGSALEVAQRDMGNCCSPYPALSPALLIYEMSARFLGAEWAQTYLGQQRHALVPQVSWSEEGDQT